MICPTRSLPPSSQIIGQWERTHRWPYRVEAEPVGAPLPPLGLPQVTRDSRDLSTSEGVQVCPPNEHDCFLIAQLVSVLVAPVYNSEVARFALKWSHAVISCPCLLKTVCISFRHNNLPIFVVLRCYRKLDPSQGPIMRGAPTIKTRGKVPSLRKEFCAGRWRRHLRWGTDCYFKIESDDVWGLSDQFEPLLVYVCLPFVVHSPKLAERATLLEQFGGPVHGTFVLTLPARERGHQPRKNYNVHRVRMFQSCLPELFNYNSRSCRRWAPNEVPSAMALRKPSLCVHSIERQSLC
jgi:hypothetical protein